MSMSLQFIEQLLSLPPLLGFGVICAAARKRGGLSVSRRPRSMTWHGLLPPDLILPPSTSSPLPAAFRAGPQPACRKWEAGSELRLAPAAPAAPPSQSRAP